MRLGKRFGYIYLCAFITSVIICIGFTIGFFNGSKSGERLRAVEISKGVEWSLIHYLDSKTQTRSLYSKLIENNYDTYNGSSFDFPKDSSLLYATLVNSKTQDFVNIKGDFNPTLFIDTYNTLPPLPSYENSGVISLNNELFIITTIPVDLKDYDYSVWISPFDEAVHNYISSSTKSKTKVHTDINSIDLETYTSTVYNEEFLFSETKNSIYTFLPLNTLNSKATSYLEVLQPKNVQAMVTSNFIKYMVLIVSVFLIVNTLLYLLLKKTIIKRILSLNKAVNCITNENTTLILNDDKEYSDEISDLTTEITHMSTRLISAGKMIKENELINKEILKTMSNGFIYCKSITSDENEIIDGEIVDINNFAKEFFNIPNDEKLLLSDLNPPFLSEEFIYELNNSIKNKNITSTHKLKLNNNKWVIFSMSSVIDGYFFIIINDITELKLYSEEMKYLASYDTLTSIYNRRKLLEYSNDLIRKNTPFTLFFIDLDNFKKINDTLGHDYGDTLLIGVSNDLKKLVSKTVKVGRLGGDEFVVIKKGDLSPKEIEETSTNIINCISKIYDLKNTKFTLNISIGVSSFPIDAESCSSIIKYADIAMYSSKLVDGNAFTIFDKKLLNDFELEEKLFNGLKNNELVTYFQPIFNVNKNKFDSAEALVRWHSKDGIIPPNHFIPLAKRTGLIVDIDKMVFNDSCKLCKEFKEKYGEYIVVSINISYSLLTQPNFVEFVLSTIRSYDIPLNFIKLEITEDETIKDLPYIISILTELKNEGVLVALDDFGVGYSSFNYINQLPLDTIKIDRSLIAPIEDDNKTLSLVQDLITLLKSLQLEVVCEGVEESSQLTILKNFGCDKIQGFLFSAPVNKSDFHDFIDSYSKK
ncbi:MAG: EAL domain-containing protein [Clostridium sp.]